MTAVPGGRREAAAGVAGLACDLDDGGPFDGLREECGVFAIHGARGEIVAPAVHLALYALQHRGQESAGIATSDGTTVMIHKGMGLVAQVFDRGQVGGLRGHLGIGHVRYSTMGSASLNNAQPIFVRSPWGDLALAHNGNLTNAPALRAELEAKGVQFTSTTDSEVIAHLMATAPAAAPEDAAAYAMARIEGAYTVVVLVGGMLLGFRDAYAIRPLMLGRSGERYALASETCAFDHIGAVFVRDVDAGEVLAIDAGGLRSLQAIPRQRLAHCVFEYIYFARPDTQLRARNVHSARKRMGRILAREHPVDADVVIPVPDSGMSAALGYAEAAAIPYEMGLIKNRYIGRTFIQPDQATRDFGVQVKLNPVREVIEGKRVILVDDSIVRGTTSGKIVRLLRRTGAREVHMRISSPPIRFPCFYGIDTSSRGELVASAQTVEQIREMIGADSLGYLSQDALAEALDLPRRELCMACLDGHYPTTVPTEAQAGRFALEHVLR
ncbi:MAG: amidophosphoribosyltransferase [Armatimonadetes bacterium]|nr:amidophosphoribosyltransferase [Armatimonadota bacterium]